MGNFCSMADSLGGNNDRSYFYLKKKNRKYDLTKFTIAAGLILAGSLGIILFIAMKMQIDMLIHN